MSSSIMDSLLAADAALKLNDCAILAELISIGLVRFWRAENMAIVALRGKSRLD